MADVEKRDEAAEDEEELDCSVPEVVNKYQFAGNVANGMSMLVTRTSLFQALPRSLVGLHFFHVLGLAKL